MGNTSYIPLDEPTTVIDSGFDDTVSGAIPIPFYFYFNGIGYNSCYVSSNRFLTFGLVASATNFTPIQSSENYAGCISAYGRDLIRGGSAIEYQTYGS